MKRVVIVGGGFAGLRAARALAGSGLDVVLVDREDHHLFTPLLYQVATAALEPGAVAIPLRAILQHWPGVSFRQTDVRGLEPARRELLAARRGRRDQAAVDASLAALAETAAGTGDLMPPIVAAVAVDATLGEVCGALRDVFGSFRPGSAAAI